MVANPQSAANWLEVFNWGHIILHQPKRRGRHHKLSSVIKRRLSAYSAEGGTPGVSEIVQQHKYSTATLSQALAAKVEYNNVRAAVRMLMSDDSPASPSPESLKALNEKHPAASNALTDFTNLVIAGRCPEAVAPVFFGGRLLALSKKTGGIRLIDIGFTLRRLASKCANSFGTKKLASFFYPHQLRISTPGGFEAAVHSARRYLEALPEDHVLVKLDLSNAFNSIHKRKMLLSVHSRMPELYSFCCSA